MKPGLDRRHLAQLVAALDTYVHWDAANRARSLAEVQELLGQLGDVVEPGRWCSALERAELPAEDPGRP